jgi:hypothetical protein
LVQVAQRIGWCQQRALCPSQRTQCVHHCFRRLRSAGLLHQAPGAFQMPPRVGHHLLVEVPRMYQQLVRGPQVNRKHLRSLVM